MSGRPFFILLCLTVNYMGSATLQTARKLIKCRTAPVLFFERGHKTK